MDVYEVLDAFNVVNGHSNNPHICSHLSEIQFEISKLVKGLCAHSNEINWKVLKDLKILYYYNCTLISLVNCIQQH